MRNYRSHRSRRAALGKLGNPEHTRYLVTEHLDGTRMLTPAVVMTAHEEALRRHPEIQGVGTAGVLVAKHRTGPTGKARLPFIKHHTRFANMAKGMRGRDQRQ